MSTLKQDLGEFGEEMVSKHCVCPKCKKGNFLKRLPNNFKCADLVCDFCGYLGQVKAVTVSDISILPKKNNWCRMGTSVRPNECWHLLSSLYSFSCAKGFFYLLSVC